MPVEKIHSSVMPGDVGEPLHLRVGWSREASSVQIASINPESPFKWEESETSPSTGGAFDGWFVSLERSQINDLIRVLRKARDQAFGQDA